MFDAQNVSLKKKVVLLEDESIPNSCMITNAVNTKEYFEQFKNRDFSKNIRESEKTLHLFLQLCQ